jgi:aminoglycoside phosphotransferase (APT) family kinase protein
MTRAAWGFKNRTDIVTTDAGERVVRQQYRRRESAEYRLRVTRALHVPAAEAGVPLPRVLRADLQDDPPWAELELMPGEPVFEHGDGAVAALARPMGELLAAFRELPVEGIELDDLWAEPARLADRARDWGEAIADPTERTALANLLDGFADLFADRPAVLAHGDFAPVNVLTDGTAITGLIDLEDVRLADPLFDAAWWSWTVSFSDAPAEAWPAFLDGAALEDDEERIEALQVLRMLELLNGATLSADTARVVAGRLKETLT